MIDQIFGFSEPPFSNTPDPKFFFPTETHRMALKGLLSGVRDKKGFLLLTGDVGTGKTTLCRTLLKKLDGAVDSALVLNPDLSAEEILRVILRDFGLPVGRASKNDLMELFYEFLVERARMGRNTLIVIDDAQNLPRRSMEQIRMISNFETEKKKLVQILLVGQPELMHKLSEPEFRQFKQRIAVQASLRRLYAGETADYIKHRMTVAGDAAKASLFTGSALKAVHRASGGYPRSINTLCDHLLAAVRRDKLLVIDHGLVKDTIRLSGMHRSWKSLLASNMKTLQWPVAYASFILLTGVITYMGLQQTRLDSWRDGVPESVLSGRLAEMEKSLASLERKLSPSADTTEHQAKRLPPEELERQLNAASIESDNLRKELRGREAELQDLYRDLEAVKARKAGLPAPAGDGDHPSFLQRESRLKKKIDTLQRESRTKEEGIRTIEKELDSLKRKLRESEIEKERLARDLQESKQLAAAAESGKDNVSPAIIEQLKEENDELKRSRRLMAKIAANTIKSQGNQIQRLTKEKESLLKTLGKEDAAPGESADGKTSMISSPSP